MRRTRPAGEDDAEPIARLQIAAWRAGYRHIVPRRWLDELDVTERAERWRGRLGPASDPASPTFVAVDGAGPLTGFVHTGPARDEDLDRASIGEVYTIYVEPGAWRRGVGTTLLEAVDRFWSLTAVHELVLWTFEANADARAFYEARGWHTDGARQIDDFGDAQVAEIRYRRTLD